MNTDTGAIYRTQDEIIAAQARGEPLAMVSERVARAVTIGGRVLAKATRKRKRQATKRSKRANRS